MALEIKNRELVAENKSLKTESMNCAPSMVQRGINVVCRSSPSPGTSTASLAGPCRKPFVVYCFSLCGSCGWVCSNCRQNCGHIGIITSFSGNFKSPKTCHCECQQSVPKCQRWFATKWINRIEFCLKFIDWITSFHCQQSIKPVSDFDRFLSIDICFNIFPCHSRPWFSFGCLTMVINSDRFFGDQYKSFKCLVCLDVSICIICIVDFGTKSLIPSSLQLNHIWNVYKDRLIQNSPRNESLWIAFIYFLPT